MRAVHGDRGPPVSESGTLTLDVVPAMPPGVRLVHWESKPAPVVLTHYSVVTDVDRFILMTLLELRAALAGKRWQAGHRSMRELVDRLEQCGVHVEVSCDRATQKPYRLRATRWGKNEAWHVVAREFESMVREGIPIAELAERVTQSPIAYCYLEDSGIKAFCESKVPVERGNLAVETR